ncbi:ATP-dependent DNA helicase PIF1-like protein [Tanacetum coccineum]
MDLYHNLCSVVTQGDTNVVGLGKRIVLPRTFTGSPRYMMQNYHDAMAICRAYGNPNLFITFTSNPKWPELAEMLNYFPGQKAHDRPEVGTRVFKIKLTELLNDLTKKHIFEESRAAKLPSPTDDPGGYKVVTDYMLHGPCGKDVRYAACTTDGKCSKHFPKAFLPETFLDEEGYPHYRQRDNKVIVKKGKFTYNNKHVLSFHLPNQNAITIRDSESLPALLQREGIDVTMFTDWISYSSPASSERYYLRMLLNVVRGVQSFKELMTVNNIICPTFKEACFAYSLLNDDKEWTNAILEASLWALGPQLEDIFVTMLLFCDVSRPLKLWEETWQILSKDILHKKRKLFNYPELHLTDVQIRNYCLLKIQDLLHRYGRSLEDFKDLPWPDPSLLTNMDNRLIREALDFDMKKASINTKKGNFYEDVVNSVHNKKALDFDINPEQRLIYEDVVNLVHNKKGNFYFVYGLGGTRNTFLYKNIISRLRSERMIVLAVASSRIASLLLLVGRTANSRFVISLDLMENNTCGIKQNMQLADLMQEAKLLVIPKAKRPKIVQACKNMSGLWKHCNVFTLTRNMRVNEYSANRALDASKQEFNRWVLAMGDGNLPGKFKEGEDEPTWIEILERFLIKQWDAPIEQIMAETYPNFTSRQTDEEYLKVRAILTPRNEDADAINEFMFKKLSGEAVTYNSADEICKASTDNIDQHQLYPVEFLNSLNLDL